MFKKSTLLLCILLGITCSPKTNLTSSEQEPPNILLIVSEDNGPDLKCYGNPYVSTPNVDQLANEGVLFSNAFVTYSVCSPSRSTIFTGLFPHQNGQIGLATHKFGMIPGIKTLPVYLKESGYRTGCLGKIHVNPEKDVPFDFHPIKGANFSKKNLPSYATEAGKFFNASSDPFFMMVNFPDAHFPVQKQVEGMPKNPLEPKDLDSSIPFIGADSERLREFTANYYNCMNRLDESIGMLLKKLNESGKRNNTLIIYIGDHGAQFSRGKCSNYESGLKVPLVISWPKVIQQNQIKKELVSSIDLLPTILAFSGNKIPESLPGLSLKNLLIEGNVSNWRNHIFADGEGSAVQFYFPRRSARGERFKLIENLLQDRDNPKFKWYAEQKGVHFAAGTSISEIENASVQIQQAYKTWKEAPQFELYDLESDPMEWKNLAGDPAYSEIKKSLILELRSWQKKTNDPLVYPDRLAALTSEIDQVYATYPNLGYRSNSNFKWKYHDNLKMSIPKDLQSKSQGEAIFIGGEEGYFNYRIPSILTTKKGTILAMAEGRNVKSDHAANDLVMKRSFDNGQTWSSLKVVAEDGDNNLNNPTLVELEGNSRILLMYQVFPEKFHARAIPRHNVKLALPGWDDPKAQKTFVIHSDNEGETWSKPKDVTRWVKAKENIVAIATGPGVGIQLSKGVHKGRIIMPNNETWYEGRTRKFNVYATFSDDMGETWKRGTPAPSDPEISDQKGYGNEVQMVEIENGWILLNTRSNAGNRLRKTAISKDGGVTWSTLTDDPQLPEPQCMGSILRYSVSADQSGDVLLYSGPLNQFSRSQGSILLSYDNGKSWPKKMLIEKGFFAYSCLTQLSNGHIGLLYEAEDNKNIKFVKISPEWNKFSDRDPMRISKIELHDPVLPILLDKEFSPTARLNILTTGVKNPIHVKSISMTLENEENLSKIESFGLFSTGTSSSFKSDDLIGNEVNSGVLTFAVDQTFNVGENHFWLTVQLKENTDLSSKISFNVKKISINGIEEKVPSNSNSIFNRIGLALRKHMDDGVHTYRIPGLVTTNKGTLISVYDLRWNSGVDLQEDVDVGMSRSTDGGETWEPMKVIMDMKEWGGKPDRENGIGDPSVLVDEQTNTIWVAAIWAHGHPGKRNWWASKPGLDPSLSSQLVLVKSEDDGMTWSDPINVTTDLKDPKWYLLLQGPGRGITMNNGTLVFPAQFKDENQMPHSTILYSKDHGNTWQLGTGARSNTTESQVVELGDGKLMLNMRDNRGRNPVGSGARAVSTTTDMGKTWIEHPTSGKALPEPVCNAGLLKHSYSNNLEEKDILIFINPADPFGRREMTLKVSFDEGETWPQKYHLMVDEGYGRGYPSLTSIDKNTIGILYEGSQADLVFQKISINDLLEQE